jgi:hypothetical protein
VHEEHPNLRYVQGTIGSEPAFGHGWVTFTQDGLTMVYDAVLDVEMTLERYEILGAVEIASWPKDEVVSKMMAEGNYGAWHDVEVLHS